MSDRTDALAAQVALDSQSIDTVISILKGMADKDEELAAAKAEIEGLNKCLDDSLAVMAANGELLARAIGAIGLGVPSKPSAESAAPALSGAVAEQAQ